MPLAITGPWLAAVDLDVCRIPNRTLASTAAATIAALIGLAAVGNTTQAITGTIGGIIAGALFAILHAATRGGIGFGDVKLVTVIGLAIGPLGLPIALDGTHHRTHRGRHLGQTDPPTIRLRLRTMAAARSMDRGGNRFADLNPRCRSAVFVGKWSWL